MYEKPHIESQIENLSHRMYIATRDTCAARESSSGLLKYVLRTRGELFVNFAHRAYWGTVILWKRLAENRDREINSDLHMLHAVT